jgi:hypothetical protein
MPLINRIKTHAHISARLADFSDVELSQLVHGAKPLHSGIGGNSALLTIDDVHVFVKKGPITALERLPENIMSTANMFELPLVCQYGVGSPGFGAWREVAAHVITTDWVLSGECVNFPLLYHFRILPASDLTPGIAKELEDIDSVVKFWDDSQAVRNRLEAMRDASDHIVLFLEYFPESLYRWFGTRLQAGGTGAAQAIAFVEANLKATTDFMSARGFVHFDAHFENMLTDGRLVYLSDFGLTLSSKFDLAKEEIEFLKGHQTFDRCANIVYLMHSVITRMFGKDRWQLRLRNYIDGDLEEFKPRERYKIDPLSSY